MRLASLLLLVGVGSAAFGCASSSHDASSDSTAALSGIPNTMDLRMEYDVASSTIRATVGLTLMTGDQLRLQIIRGRLDDSQPALDCTTLPVAPPMPDGAVGYSSTQVTYQGPLTDPSLLATVYSTDWIEAHVSAAGLEELQTQGADSIVEACIMNSAGYARSKVQTTIANAWNQNDPILDGHGLTQGSSSGATSTTEATE